MTRGFVIGKFYPPHRGHKYLIDTALSQVDELTVAVCDNPTHAIPAALRAKWLQEIHPAARIIVVEDSVADDDSEGWARYTKEFLGYTPDVVFTSEAYGDAYTKYLGAKHVLVDKERKTVPISGTTVRKDPLTHLEYLEPCVRDYFLPRVAIVGAESTGTTTLTRALATHYNTSWIPEYGRYYSEGKWTSKSPWKSEEFSFIARLQNETEDMLARYANRILFCDTNAFATQLWEERYLGSISPAVEALARRPYDLYIVTAPDIPFEDDGLRDGEHVRHHMHGRFLEEVKKLGVPHIVVTGSKKMRLQTAIAACEALLEHKGLPVEDTRRSVYSKI